MRKTRSISTASWARSHPVNPKTTAQIRPSAHHGAVAVQQDEGQALALLEIMEVDPLDIEEAAGRWVVPLRLTCASSDQQSRGPQNGCRG